MRRFLAVLFALAFCLTISATPRNASAVWVNQPVQFRISNQGGYYSPTGIFVRDTTYTRFGGDVTTSGALDTTSVFTPTGVGVVGQAAGAGSRSDSLLVGWLIFQTDSSASVGAMSSVQIAIDGRIGGVGNPATMGEWVFLDSLSVAIANGVDAVQIPIQARGVSAKHVLGFPELRARTVAGVGVLPSARCVWRHWVPGTSSIDK